MTTTQHIRRGFAVVLAALLTTVGFAVVGPAAQALAEPTDREGGTPTLRKQLDEATTGYLEAKEALAGSRKRQQALTVRLTQIDAELAVRRSSIGPIVRQAYRAGRLGPVATILNATSPDSFLDRALTLNLVAIKQDRALRDLSVSKTAQQRARIELDREIRLQTKQLNVMAKRKAQAENALAAAGGGGVASAPGGGGSATAARAPRNANGSLPTESCSANDPTTSGCITPRTLHALREAKKDGFTRFVSCFRQQNSGEHPKGRACDFAADRNGFGGVATGSSRTYGNRLANYFINNGSRLGVLYVIWFERIWLPSSGWRAYTRGNGDPSSDHTNHVHLSMR